MLDNSVGTSIEVWSSVTTSLVIICLLPPPPKKRGRKMHLHFEFPSASWCMLMFWILKIWHCLFILIVALILCLPNDLLQFYPLPDLNVHFLSVCKCLQWFPAPQRDIKSQLPVLYIPHVQYPFLNKTVIALDLEIKL